ncbi:MAG: tRNA pseudouridine(55) synthase TruB [Myxococcales bacterium]|nr:tRNA pseudouridine(55) synthase TruB [Myxococcales bacterium]
MSRRRRSRRRGGFREIDGIVVVDKPAGPTSFGVVKALREALRVGKAGHTGTLDPFATGVLPICVGQATKVAQLLLADDKRYAATAQLGVSTDSYDITGAVTAEADASAITREQVEAALEAFRGEILQSPPAYSALRKDGKRAHALARAGEAVELEPRRVTITRLEITGFEPGARAELRFEVDCSKGTYIRSLAHDLGVALGCGAALSALRRVAAGTFGIEQSVALSEIQANPEVVPLITIDEALAHLPSVDIEPQQAERLAQGQPLAVGDASLPAGVPLRVHSHGELVALGERKGDRIWPKRMLWSPPTPAADLR